MNCNIIKDLLPLYVDECCSTESTELVRAHLAGCADCRKACAQMASAGAAQPKKAKLLKPRRVRGWQASLLQSLMLFISFGVITAGVVLEGNTPTGFSNGLYAAALIVPATGYLLSLSHWFFLRAYRSRKRFCIGSVLATVAFTALGALWAFWHYGSALARSLSGSLVTWVGVFLCAVFFVLSGALSNLYALLLGRE